jgi:hypothetical protein
MSLSRRKLSWLLFAAIAIGIAVDFRSSERSAVTLKLLELGNKSGTPVARVEMRNSGDKPIVYWGALSGRQTILPMDGTVRLGLGQISMAVAIVAPGFIRWRVRP